MLNMIAQHCDVVAKKVNAFLYCVNRSTMLRWRIIMALLSSGLVSLFQLEYWVLFLAPLLKQYFIFKAFVRGLTEEY